MLLLSYEFAIFICISSCMFFYCLNEYFVFKASDALNFEVLKCPFCFGDSLCNVVDEIELYISLGQAIIDKFDRKFVFYGKFEDSKIVLKKLASSSDRFFLEDRLSELFDHDFNYYDFKFEEEANRFYYESLVLLNKSYHDANYKLRWCPTLTGVTQFFTPIIQKSIQNTAPLHFWTSLILNPEPIILQAFQSEKGWPVPKYFGSCGQFILVENCGRMLTHYRNSPWIFRIHIAEELLLMAQTFTFKHPQIGVYLRDLSYDNVVIDDNLKTRVVDLEHILLVDKSLTKDLPQDWNTDHVSEHFDCHQCIQYSPKLICSHRISDHNIYAVCKEFFHSSHPNDYGILHSFPNNTVHQEKFLDIYYYLEECIQPSQNNSRFFIAEKLINLLTEVKHAEKVSVKEMKAFYEP